MMHAWHYSVFSKTENESVTLESTVKKAKDVPIHQRFAADIAAGVQYADALERHVSGRSTIRRETAIKTLQAIGGLNHDDLVNLLWWAKQQEY